MKYKLGKTIWTFTALGTAECHSVNAQLTEPELLEMGATPIDSELREKQSMGEMYKCPSYYDNNNQLQDCTCGKCGEREPIKKKYCHNCRVGDNFQYADESECDCDCHKPKKIELPTELGTLTDFSQSYGTCTGTLKFVGPTTQMKKWMESVTNWINSQNKGE